MMDRQQVREAAKWQRSAAPIVLGNATCSRGWRGDPPARAHPEVSTEQEEAGTETARTGNGNAPIGCGRTGRGTKMQQRGAAAAGGRWQRRSGLSRGVSRGTSTPFIDHYSSQTAKIEKKRGQPAPSTGERARFEIASGFMRSFARCRDTQYVESAFVIPSPHGFTAYSRPYTCIVLYTRQYSRLT